MTHLLDHADSQALVEAAGLAPVPRPLVDRAVLVPMADVPGIPLDGPLEETLASLARSRPVVPTDGVVAAHCTQQVSGLGVLEPSEVRLLADRPLWHSGQHSRGGGEVYEQEFKYCDY